MDEIKGAYAHLLGGARGRDARGGASADVDELRTHAHVMLASLGLGAASHARREQAIDAQLSAEGEAASLVPLEIGAKRVLEADAAMLQLERLVVDGLANRQDLSAALRVAMFDAFNGVPLRVELSQRLAGTALGKLAAQVPTAPPAPPFSSPPRPVAPDTLDPKGALSAPLPTRSPLCRRAAAPRAPRARPAPRQRPGQAECDRQAEADAESRM